MHKQAAGGVTQTKSSECSLNNNRDRDRTKCSDNKAKQVPGTSPMQGSTTKNQVPMVSSAAAPVQKRYARGDQQAQNK